MSDDEPSIEKANRKGKGFSASQIIMGFLFIVGLLVGGAAAHYLVEPFLNSQLLQNYSSCNATNQRLNAEISECIASNNQNSPTIAKVEMTITGGGPLPPGTPEQTTYTLYATGSMTDQNKDKPLSQTKFGELSGLILQNGFMNLNESYADESSLDSPTVTIRISQPAKTKTVSCNGNCPLAFGQVKQKIEELWG